MRKSASCDVDHEKEDVVNKRAWSKQEDQKLIDYIHTHGEGCWRTLPKAAGLIRCSKSCRLRWTNYLRPNLKRGNFGEYEDGLIIKLHALLGNRWSLIAGRLPGRTDIEVKNYWNSLLKGKIINQGNDPNSRRLHSLLPPMHHHAAAISDDSTFLRCNVAYHCKFNHKIEKTHVQVNNDDVSDAARCLNGAGNYCVNLPDLNLEFAM